MKKTTTTILGIGAAITIAIGGITVMNNKVEQEHKAFLATTHQGVESEDNYSAELKERELALKTVKRPKDVSAWVYKLDTYPKSKERDALAEHVIAVLEDNEITDDEYNALGKEMAELESINNVRKIRNTAEKTLSDNK